MAASSAGIDRRAAFAVDAGIVDGGFHRWPAEMGDVGAGIFAEGNHAHADDRHAVHDFARLKTKVSMEPFSSSPTTPMPTSTASPMASPSPWRWVNTRAPLGRST